jgi:hypothetical protein
VARSPELSTQGSTVRRSSPQRLNKGESIEGILTAGKGRRSRCRKRPAAMSSSDNLMSSMGRTSGRGNEERSADMEVVENGVLLGALYRVGASNRGVGEERRQRMAVELHQCVGFIGKLSERELTVPDWKGKKDVAAFDLVAHQKER